ncbi:MAG: MerR family transcriptional regulator [Leptolyngbyaceae cyanobacterium MO_188.B28]|nr:MerR family transcriptional regulator [Leptolyngbyaceae cyanobacterium MO_188.B28]
MLIGELSEVTGLSKDTIRFYEKRGLIQAENGSPGKGRFKTYGEEALRRLTLIQKAKRLGFTLGQIKQEIEAWESNELSWDEKIAIIHRQVALVDERIGQLQETREHLIESVRYLKNLKAGEHESRS